MSTEIYYFSGTGNSLHVAKELQKRIPEAKLIPILGLVDKECVTTIAIPDARYRLAAAARKLG